MSDVEVKFLRDYTVNDPECPDEYAKGEKVKMSEASANHFVRRRIAERLTKLPDTTARKARKPRKANDDKPPPPPDK